MSLFQKLIETYDLNEHIAGEKKEGHHVLAPVGHMAKTVHIDVKLDMDGNLLNMIELPRDFGKVIIPVTIDSAGRTSGIQPHPLCDNVAYLSGQDSKKHDAYIKQLESWANSKYSHPYLKPILTYISKKTLLKDMAENDIALDKADDKIVSFSIADRPDIPNHSIPCWGNNELVESFNQWYENDYLSTQPKELCYISGKDDAFVTNHPKGIISSYGYAKLISYTAFRENDAINMGRFLNVRETSTVGYEASQKAHNILRWLVAEQGIYDYAGKTFLCWNSNGNITAHVTQPLLSKENDQIPTTEKEYKNQIMKVIDGYTGELSDDSSEDDSPLPDTSETIVAIFDSPSAGRLSLTYYSELPNSDFLERLKEWDEHCCWYGYNSEHGRYDAVNTITLREIALYAYGTLSQKGEAYTYTVNKHNSAVIGLHLQTLIACRVDKRPMPIDILRQLVDRASNPQAYSYNKALSNRLLAVTCAVIKKYHWDHYKEEISMSLDEGRADRSYLFGRLLAVFERVEADTYTDEDKARTPSALKLQSTFRQHPLHTANIIETGLERSYFGKLSPKARAKYKALIGEIMGKLRETCHTERDWNSALGDMYLIGYYTQRQAFFAKSNNETEIDIEKDEENK